MKFSKCFIGLMNAKELSIENKIQNKITQIENLEQNINNKLQN